MKMRIVVMVAVLAGVAFGQRIVRVSTRLAVPVAKQLVVPERRATKVAVTRVEINTDNETVYIEYQLQTASGEQVKRAMLSLQDRPASLNAKGDIVTPALTRYSDYVNATGTLDARNEAALKAAGVL